MKGKGVKIMHIFGDNLWAIASQALPNLVDEGTQAEVKESYNDYDGMLCELSPKLATRKNVYIA